MNSRKVAVVGIFGALAFLLAFIEFPIIPLLPFLKFDPSDCMVFLVTLIYGFFPGLFTLLIKNFLFIFRSGEGGLIGILMNILAGTVFIFFLTTLRKLKINVWVNYIISSLITGVVAFLLNYYIAIPIFTNQPTLQFVQNIGISVQIFFYLVLLFNFIKFFTNSFVSHLLVKKTRIENFIKEKAK